MADSATSGSRLFRGAAAYEPRTPWPPLRALLASVAIVGVSILGASLLFVGKTASSGVRQDVTELATLGIWQTTTVVLTIVVSAMFGGKVRDVLALRAPVGAPFVYIRGIALLAALQIAVSLVQYSFFQQDMYADLRPFARLFGEQWVLALLVVGVGAPLSEELLFRGFLLSALARSGVGFWGGTLITTGLWTALHAGYSAAGIVEVFLIGLFFSWLLWRTGSLRVAIFCHALYNSLIVLALRYVPLPT